MKVPPGAKYLALAVVVGLVAVFLIHRYITTTTQVVQVAKDPVVVAEVDISPGTALEPRLLRVDQWPKNIIPPRTVRSPQEVQGRVVQTFIAKGEPILTTKLAPEGTAAGLGGLLAPDKLAVTIKTDEVTGVAGFINPGDRVDVLVELPAPEGQGEHISKIILQNIKVLSKGQIFDPTAPKDKPQVVNTVTLEVTPEQAEALNLATFQGKIRLALRNQLNQAQFMTRGVVTSQLVSRPALATPPTTAQPTPPERQAPAAVSIEVIKGMKREAAQL
jgi:pilus assembly protein CpaB